MDKSLAKLRLLIQKSFVLSLQEKTGLLQKIELLSSNEVDFLIAKLEDSEKKSLDALSKLPSEVTAQILQKLAAINKEAIQQAKLQNDEDDRLLLMQLGEKINAEDDNAE